MLMRGIFEVGSLLTRMIRLLSVAFCLMAWTAPALAANACSSSIGKVSLNEYNYLDNFTEVKKLDTSVSMTGWNVTVYTSNKTTSGSLPASGANSCFGGMYQVNQFAVNEISQNADVVLFDNNNDVVDIVRVRTASNFPVTTAFYPSLPACGFISPPYDLLVSAANKGVDRLPDGTGNWRNTPGTGSGSFQSRCGPNIAGGNADLAVTKGVNLGTVVKGSPVTFTVGVQNTLAGSGTASNVLVNDLLPSGFSYVSHTVTAGSYAPSTGVWTVGTLAFGASASLTITATTTLVGTLTNTATVASDTYDPATANNTAAASVIVTSPGATLDAVEVGAAAGTPIRTRIAATGFSLDIVALDTAGAIATGYNKTVTIELVDAGSSASCGSMMLLQSVGTYTFTGSGGGKDNGRKTYAFNYANVATNVRVRLRDNGSPAITACSTDNFAIRPASLGSMTVSDADSVTAGTARTLDNIGANGGNVHKSGRPFRVAATAFNSAGATTTNYNGSPAATLSACLLPGSACTLGTLNPGTWTAASGVVVSTTATYSEIGAFTMKWVDTSFADVDLADSSTAERYVESAAFNVGRFVPDHFVLTTASTPQFKTFNDTACPTRSFTYMGQPFAYLTLPQATITAKNAAGGTTANYAGALWKLAAAGATQTYTAATGTLDTGLVGTPVVTASGAGVGSLAANAADVVAFTRTTPVAPFNASISLSMSIVDNAENAVAGNGLINTATPALFSSMAFDSGNEIRFGQLVLTNAHGSELLGLPVPVETRYWNGSGFSRNTADACTQLVSTNVALSNWRRDLNACETSVSLSGRFNAGRGNLKLSRPGAGNTGSVDLTLLLGATGAGSTCVAGVVSAAGAAAQSWLQGRWTGAAYDQNPAARGSFGLHRGSKPLIYFREMYY
ncbi:MAG: DUF11 domain-containing protein [Thiobacillus sp.]|nr:DUF11 domain-containing protein [Thiobacillus sp.]